MSDDFTYTWRGRDWRCKPHVSPLLLRRLVRACTPGQSGETAQRRASRNAGRYGRALLVAATVESLELVVAMGQASREEVEHLVDRVVPGLLDHYALTTATDADAYAARRRLVHRQGI